MGVNTRWQRHIVEDEAAFSLCCSDSDPCFRARPKKPSSKVRDVPLNAKSRNVSWRLCKSPWDWELAAGRSGDGQDRKHTESWMERAGQGQYIFSFDVASQRDRAAPRGNLRTVILRANSEDRAHGVIQFSTQVHFTNTKLYEAVFGAVISLCFIL